MTFDAVSQETGVGQEEGGSGAVGRSKMQRTDSKTQSESTFECLAGAVGQALTATGCYFTLSLAGERSQFIRFNQSKVRQTGQVQDAQLLLTLMADGRVVSAQVPFTGDFEADWPLANTLLSTLQQDLPQCLPDPYWVLPKALVSDSERISREVYSGQLLPLADVASTILSPVCKADFVGFYAGGTSYRAYADSAGTYRWFETPAFTLDYSLFAGPEQAVKGTLAGRNWDENIQGADYAQAIARCQEQLICLTQPPKSISRGTYRTYLAPAATADLMATIAAGGLGESALQQGDSAFEKLANRQVQLSEKFSLSEDFQRAGVPRFNERGEVAAARIPIIERGQWRQALVNSRSAKEYGKPANAANRSEQMRAPVVTPGQLRSTDILSELDTGLYVSNLHYLNWSDLSAGRITGMTRYACFWVEAGKIVAPIENLRFDDSLYRFLGEGLIALDETQRFVPAVDTYTRRSLGGIWTPGMLIDQFRYTL